jgi:MYXO-CTERM domain-containing protein
MANKRKSTSNRGAVQRRQRRAAARATRRGSGSSLPAGAAIALGLGLSASGARAATFEVTTLADSGAGSLRAAIEAANAAAGADMITFQSGLTGTITLTSGQLEIEDSVIIDGPGASVLAVSGNDASRVFYIAQYVNDLEVTISGLKITHGSVTTNGAGVQSGADHLTLHAVEITANAAAQDTGQGGGVFATAAAGVTIEDSVIFDNTAHRGGGIYAGPLDGELEIQSSRITGNAAQTGAGLFIENAKAGLTIEQSTLSGNHAMADLSNDRENGTGGAMYVRRTGTGATTAVRASTLSGNTATQGAALAFYDPRGQILVENATLSDNQATNGAAIYCAYCEDPFMISHATIAGHVATGNGTILVQKGLVTLSHTIVADNTAAANQLFGMFAADHCLIEAPGSSSITDGGGNVLGMDPQLGALQDNGGPTETQLPASTSPAVDAGDMALASPPMFDQRNTARVVGARIDIGAVERNAGSLECSVAEASVAENAGNVIVTVTRTGGTDGDVTVDYETGDGTATAPDDYTNTTGTLQWSQGDGAPKTIQVAVADDSRAESNETFVVHVSNASSAALGTVTTTTVTVTDDDSGPTLSAIDDQAVTEGGMTSPIAITIGDADDPAANLTLSATSSNHTILADAGIVFDGSGANRTLTITALTAGAGESTVTVTVSDGTNEATRTFKVTVTTLSGGDKDAGAPSETSDSGAGSEMNSDAGVSDADASMGHEDAADGGSGAGSESEGDGGNAGKSSSDSGCGCDVPGHDASAPKSLLAGMLGLVTLILRRRRRGDTKQA